MPFGTEKIAETSKKMSESLDRMVETTSNLESKTDRLADQMNEMNENMGKLVDATDKLAAQTEKLNRSMADSFETLPASMDKVAEAINNFAKVMSIFTGKPKSVVGNVSENIENWFSSIIPKPNKKKEE